MEKLNTEFTVGDEISMGFNGDWYPLGKVVSVSKSGRFVNTGNRKFVRQSTGFYKFAQTFTLVHGFYQEQNPHF